MNKYLLVWMLFITGIMGMAMMGLCGCAQLMHPETIYDETVPLDTLRTIQPLVLDEVEEEPNQLDMNEIPPETLELSLEECRALALGNNLELKATLINPILTQERIGEERARFEAAFSANMSLDKLDNPQYDDQAQLAGTSEEILSTGLSLEQPLLSGGTIGFDFGDSEVETNATGTQFNPYYGSGATFSISQPLLRNAGNTATYGIRLYRLENQITNAQTKLEVIRIIADLDRTYWRLYATRKERDVRKQQHELAMTQLEQVRRLVNSGERAQVEVFRAEAGVAERLEGIIVAENNLRDRERELKQIINRKDLAMQDITVIMPITDPSPRKYILNPDELVHTAWDKRMELLVLELQLLGDDNTIQYRKNQILPFLGFSYRYNIDAFGATRGDSYDMLWDSQFADHRFGLSVSIPIGNQSAQSRLRQVTLQRYQRLATHKNRKALIEMEVLNAVDQLKSNWQRILATRQNTILAGRLYEAEKRQFELGSRTSTEVLDAQASLANAQSAEIAAITEYQIALVDLAYATGTLLGAANIEWEPVQPNNKGLLK